MPSSKRKFRSWFSKYISVYRKKHASLYRKKLFTKLDYKKAFFL